MQTKVLIIDDEKPIRDMLAVSLKTHGFECYEAGTAYQAKYQIDETMPDIILVDWMMPNLTGIEFVRQLRKKQATENIPIIMLSAKITEADIVSGLNAGVDDYMVKPFSPKELVARMQALLRRSSQQTKNAQSNHNKPTITIGRLSINQQSIKASIDSIAIDLDPTTYRLLLFFMQHPNVALNREKLLKHCVKNKADTDIRSVDVYIKRLRQTLKRYQCHHYIQTVHSVGYRLTTAETT